MCGHHRRPCGRGRKRQPGSDRARRLSCDHRRDREHQRDCDRRRVRVMVVALVPPCRARDRRVIVVPLWSCICEP